MTADQSRTARFRAARTDSARAVLEGFHAVKHAIRFGAVFESVLTRDVAAMRQLADQLAPDVTARLLELAHEVPEDCFATLSPAPPDTGVIAIAERRHDALRDIMQAPRTAPIVLLEAPAHSGNIGAVVRVAAGAGAAAVITTGSNDPWNPGAIRGAAGLHYALPVMRADLADVATAPLLVIDPEGDALTTVAIPDDAVLAFGSERSGVSAGLQQRAAARVRIPMEPGVSSLNLATAVAVVLYHWKLTR